MEYFESSNGDQTITVKEDRVLVFPEYIENDPSERKHSRMTDADWQASEDRVDQDLANYSACKKRDTGKLPMYAEADA